jgi:hypothetical protein
MVALSARRLAMHAPTTSYSAWGVVIGRPSLI